MKLFSVLVANYNNGHFFKDCYTSLINQKYKNWECIIVDDKSTDDSLKIIQDLIGKDERFYLFENDSNKGVGFTKDKCARLANGEVLGFLDPDDAITKDAISIMLNAHRNDKQASIISSKYYFVHLDMSFKSKSPYGAVLPQGHSYLTYGQGALTAFATFKKKYYEAIGGIDVTMRRAVDQDLYYKLEEIGHHIFLDRELYMYRIHHHSISANENKIKAYYWHLKAKESAYKRRKKSLKVVNLKRGNLNREFSIYYFNRYLLCKNKSVGQWKKIYFILMSMYYKPFYDTLTKIKSLFFVLINRF